MKRQVRLTKEQQVESAHIQNELGVPAHKADFAARLTKPDNAMEKAFANAVKTTANTEIVRIN